MVINISSKKHKEDSDSKMCERMSERILNVKTNKIVITEDESAYVSPYSLFFLENYPLNLGENTKLCDFGAGTGVLGIAASCFGVTNISAVENNHECFELMKINYYKNVSSKLNVSFYRTGLECEGVFDTILCNPASLPDFIKGNSFCDGGEFGVDMILLVLEYASEHLSVDGKLYMIITSILPLSIILEKIKVLEMRYEIIGRKQIPFRNHYAGISNWVDINKQKYPEMYYTDIGGLLYEELMLFMIEKGDFHEN